MCTNLVLFTRLYRDARSTKQKTKNKKQKNKKKKTKKKSVVYLYIDGYETLNLLQEHPAMFEF